MTQIEWFQMIEQERPGLLRKVWEEYLCSCTHETNVLIARDLTIHAKLRGDDVVITVGGWRHYRTSHDLVSKHRSKAIEVPASALISAPVPTLPTHRMTSSAQAIAALEAVINFLKRYGGFGISAPEEPIGDALDTLFGQHGVFSEKEPPR